MQRAILLLLCMLLFSNSAVAAVCARMDGIAALLAEDGREILPTGSYADLVSLGDGLFAASNGATWALLNERGEALSAFLYDELRLDGGLLLALRDGFWGLLTVDGAELSPFHYRQIVPNDVGGAWALRDAGHDYLYLLDADGAEIPCEIRAQEIARIGSDGLLAVRTGGAWGYCDAAGRLSIPADFEYAGPFTGGMAAVVQNGRYGAIDPSGTFIADAEYDFLEISPVGFLIATGNGIKVLNDAGHEITSYEGKNLHAALVGDGYVLADEASLRIYDASGALLQELSPGASVLEGLDSQLILTDGMWGEVCVRLLDTDTAYQNLYPLGFSKGEAVYACMQANAARYMNNLLGEIQISVDMESARYGIVDSEGALRLPCDYESIQFLADDRFLVLREGLWQMIDLEGRVYFTQIAEPSS